MRVWHIFSRVIDNYGDIAIAIRLAKQLNSLPENRAVLLAEKSNTLNELLANDNGTFKLLDIDDDLSIDAPATFIVTIFNTEIPKNYLDKISQKTKIFIYEYLTAESWTERFHLTPSLNLNPLIEKIYFYPGFSNKTGGLLREATVVKKEYKSSSINKSKIIKTSFFFYPHTKILEFLDLFDEIDYNCKALIYKGIIDKKTVLKLPYHAAIFNFLPPDQYDNLLYTSDLNFVRGEDSLCRAIFSGKPFIWQPYIQADGAHLKKLEAFIFKYFDSIDSKLKNIISDIFNDWSSGQFKSESIRNYLYHYEDISLFYADRSNQFISKKSVVENLLTIVEKS